MEMEPPQPEELAEPLSAERTSSWQSEDYWAIWLAALIFLATFIGVWSARSPNHREILEAIAEQQAALDRALTRISADDRKAVQETIDPIYERIGKLKASYAPNPWAGWLALPSRWTQSPLESWRSKSPSGASVTLWPQVAITCIVSGLLFGVARKIMGHSLHSFLIGFAGIFLLSLICHTIASHTTLKSLGLGYPLWALLIGLAIANFGGTPEWLRNAVCTEFYIKTGLVLLGAGVLMGQLLALGVPGIFVSWVVTPIVLVTTYWFGQRILRIPSRSLNMTISADMSVCGVSAAIATAAACRAKKEELSIAISLSLMFTVVMMFAMPIVIRGLGMSEVLAGAWMGGTIDATGAVAAAGSLVGPQAETVAIAIKMIQNVLIGVVAFFVALYWVTYVEPSESHSRPSALIIWQRFPKFVLGFLAASIIFSIIDAKLAGGDLLITSMVKGSTDVMRNWFFCFAFVSIGLDTSFRELAAHFRGGKPLVLYVVGQSFNLCLTLLMAWLMFEVVFPDVAEKL